MFGLHIDGRCRRRRRRRRIHIDRIQIDCRRRWRCWHLHVDSLQLIWVCNGSIPAEYCTVKRSPKHTTRSKRRTKETASQATKKCITDGTRSLTWERT